MPRLLVLDFDGVLSDSAPEAFVVALRTWGALGAGPRLAQLALHLRAPGTPGPDRVRGLAEYDAFVGMMPLGNRAEDYGVVLGAIEAGQPIPDQAAYDAFRDGHDAAWLAAYHERFYRERDTLARGDPDGWYALMAPYSRFLDVLRRRAGEVQLAIATAKDRRSVNALLRAYGVDDLFPDSSILDKETGTSKVAHLGALSDRASVPCDQIIFVDDKVNHLDSVASLGVQCALAAWGYNGPRERRIALAHGHRVCSLSDVEAQLLPRGPEPLGDADQAP